MLRGTVGRAEDFSMSAIATSQKERGALRRVERFPMQRRDSVRYRAFLKARILIQDWTKMDCMVRNMSLSGARLEASQNFILPTEFELEFPQRRSALLCALKHGSVLLCVLIWRKDEAVGVKFLNSVGPPTSAAELRSENARLRQENARLKLRVEELTGEP
jgi:hypothetical protein